MGSTRPWVLPLQGDTRTRGLGGGWVRVWGRFRVSRLSERLDLLRPVSLFPPLVRGTGTEPSPHLDPKGEGGQVESARRVLCTRVSPVHYVPVSSDRTGPYDVRGLGMSPPQPLIRSPATTSPVPSSSTPRLLSPPTPPPVVNRRRLTPELFRTGRPT